MTGVEQHGLGHSDPASTASTGGQNEVGAGDATGKRRLPPALWHAARILIGIALLGVLVATGRLDFGVVGRVRAGPGLGLLLAVAGAGIAANSLRWFCLVRAAGRAGESGPLLRTALASNLLAFISPAGAGMDAARVVHLVKGAGVPLAGAMGLGLVDRLMGIQTLLLTAAMAGWAGTPPAALLPLRGVLTWAAAGGLVALLLAFGAAHSRRLPGAGILPASLVSRLEAVTAHWRPGWGAASYACSFVGGWANIALPVLGTVAIGAAPATFESVFAGGLVTLINSAAPTPGGLGAGEGAASVLLNAASSGAEGMLVARFAMVAWAVIFALPLVFGRTRGDGGALDTEERRRDRRTQI